MSDPLQFVFFKTVNGMLMDSRIINKLYYTTCITFCISLLYGSFVNKKVSTKRVLRYPW